MPESSFAWPISVISLLEIKSQTRSPNGYLQLWIDYGIEVYQIFVVLEDTIDKLKEAVKHAYNSSALVVVVVIQSKYVWKQIDQQKYTGL